MLRRMQFVGGALVLAAALFQTGCQTVPYQGQAREVKKVPGDGGVISIAVDHRDEDRAVAEQKMSRNCAGKEVKINAEEEAVVGSKTDAVNRETNRDRDQRQVGTLFGLPLVSGDAGGKDSATSATTTALKEWHITYSCVAAKSEAPKKVR